MNFNETSYLEYLIKTFKHWSIQYDNKDKEDEFENIYYFTYQVLMNSEVNSMTKVELLGELRDIKKFY